MNAVKHSKTSMILLSIPSSPMRRCSGIAPIPPPLAELRRHGPVHALNYRVFMGEPAGYHQQ